jgi:hypothetical protein
MAMIRPSFDDTYYYLLGLVDINKIRAVDSFWDEDKFKPITRFDHDVLVILNMSHPITFDGVQFAIWVINNNYFVVEGKVYKLGKWYHLPVLSWTVCPDNSLRKMTRDEMKLCWQNIHVTMNVKTRNKSFCNLLIDSCGKREYSALAHIDYKWDISPLHRKQLQFCAQHEIEINSSIFPMLSRIVQDASTYSLIM